MYRGDDIWGFCVSTTVILYYILKANKGSRQSWDFSSGIALCGNIFVLTHVIKTPLEAGTSFRGIAEAA